MKLELPEIGVEERTPLVEALLGLIRQLADRVRELEETVQQARGDENAVLKGLKPRPQIRPSRLESPPPPADGGARPGGRPGSRPGGRKEPKGARLALHREVKLHPAPLPAGAVFKGYEPFVVQDLKIECFNTRYLRARYLLPGGGSLLAPLPAGETVPGSHYGPRAHRFVLAQYHHAHVTQPLLLELLREFDFKISSGQLSRLLTEGRDAFHEEKAELLTAGLATAAYLGVDDTGARHQGRNGFCTVLRDERFAYFASTGSKSRLNFLDVLHGGKGLYAVNATTRAYWEKQKLPAAAAAKLTAGPTRFADADAWRKHLAELAVTDERHVRIAAEGALLGGLIERGLPADLVILSDGAPQFRLLEHAACWVHAERALARLVPFNDEHAAAIEKLRGQVWELYRGLQAYRLQPDAAGQPPLQAAFDALAEQRTGYPSLDGILKTMRDQRADLLRVLERPVVPLHNNGSESDLREYVKKRKISGSTRSEDGRRCRDTFASLKKTCRKLGVRFWDYLRDRLLGQGRIPRLADLLRPRTALAAA